MGSSSWKLKALLRKNFLIMRRNICSTICEIIFPFILMLLLYFVKTIFEINNYEFEKEEGSIPLYTKNRSVYHLDTLPPLRYNESSNKPLSDDNPYIPKIPKLNIFQYGMSILPSLNICSALNSNANNKMRPGIASIGIPQEIKNILIKESNYFVNYTLFNISNSSFIDFPNEDEMNKYITSKSYGETKDMPLLCFGISYSQNKDKHEYNYSLHYFENKQYDGAADVPKSYALLDPFQTSPDLNSYSIYQHNGYTYMMKLITDYIISQETNSNDTKINFGVIPMKYKSYRSDPFGSIVGFIGPFFVIVSYLGHLCIYVYKLVLEKETKAKEGMKIMGLTDGIYFLSFFIQYLIIALIDAFINAAIFQILFTRIPYVVFFLIFILFSINIFALAYFFHSFIEKAKESLILSVILYFIMFFLSMLVTDDDANFNMKLGLSFFPPVAIYLGIILLGNFESNFRQFYFKDIFYVYSNYSVLIMFIMLIIDALLYLFLGYYLLNILPHDYGVRKPWYFLFTPSYWGCKKRKYKIINEEENCEENDEPMIGGGQINNDNFQNEDIYKEMNDPKDSLKIREVVKRFDDGKVAVNHVSLNFYKNEIFALLGHNGAGKTTLISMLTGLYEATEGEAIYDNMNIFYPDNLSIFREKLGICPQHDVLFKDLNIREHLDMFAIFKGVSSSNVKREVDKVIHDFQLEDVQYILSQNLSAGQRRKLSIAISLVGGSEIIFLDEPSSGMDITSRRNLWEILKRQSDNKIIILTTHYMEEASVLGKRIGIINLGKMKCIGTPLFLIEKFGKYMNITLNKEEGAENEQICQYITQKTGDAKFESLTEEIIARIPKDIFKGENGISLHNFFEELDDSLKELKVKSYSVSMPTLEDVFLNVAQDDDEVTRFSLKLDMQKVNDKTLFELNYLDNFSPTAKFFLDFKTNFIRRFYLTIREKKGLIMEIFCPIILVLVGCIISQIQFFYSTSVFGTKNISDLGKQTIYYSSINNEVDIEKYFIKDLINVTCKNLNNVTSIYDEIYENKSEAIYNFMENIYNTTINTESSIDNEIDITSKDYVGSYGNILFLNEPNENNTNYEFVELINSRIKQGVPLYTSAFLEQIAKRASGGNISINYQHKVMPRTAKQETGIKSASGSTVVLFVAVAYALIPANFITIIVRERINNSKHLMKLSGMNILAYWIVNFIYEIFKFYFTGGVCLLLIYLFDYYTPYLIYFYLLCGPSLILMTYIASFLFNDESQAQNMMILINALVSALLSTVIIIFRTVEKTHFVAIIFEFICCLLPSFCFSFAYSLSNNKLAIYNIDFKERFLEFFQDDSKMMDEMLLLLGPFSFLVGEIVVYLIILIVIEKLSNKSILPQHRIDIINNDEERDSKVVKEEERAQTEKIPEIQENSINNLSNNYMVRVKNLQKEYKSSFYKLCFCCGKNKGKIAIKNLNFCLERGECFGLLGLNGAGKTTAFKCITQELSPTSGEVFINGVRTNDNFEELKNKFGYCPQYDALFEYLTVYENLEFYAKLKGVKREFLTQIVNAVIYEMKLDEFTKKIAGRLSGGNKRKLSVAISMLCSPPIILLDEPSTGMDPEARRFMWSIIHKMSIMGKRSSIIMTTHSMDEAETLCKRMGIMVNGEFVCMGKANEIKNKYGYGYELSIRIKPMTEKLEDELFISKYNLDKKIKVTMNNVESILEQINRKNYIDEIQEGRLGKKLIKDMEKQNGMSINALLNWIFYVENAIKLVQYGKDNFSKIIIEENMDNSFLFKMKKKKENNKSIGYLFGLFETHKEECYVTEYSIQPTSLEQIFNKFAENQGSQLRERRSTIVEPGDVENIAMNAEERRKTIMFEKIVLNDNLINKLLDKDNNNNDDIIAEN